MEPTTEVSSTSKQDWAGVAAASAEQETKRKQASKPPRSFHEKLPCVLTNEELAERGAKIAEAYAEQDTLDAERKNVNDGYKAKIELVEGRIRELAGVLRTKQELREVELIEEFIFATNTVRVTRADTKEVVRERAMTKNERQEELPLEKKNGADKPKETKAESKDAAPAPNPTEITDPAGELGPEATAPAKGKRSRRPK
jgi:hypothetical protein